jgi:hypothetical protein
MKKLVAAGLIVLAASMWVALPAEAQRGGGSGGGPGMRGSGGGSGGSPGWSGRSGWSGGGRGGNWHGGGGWHGKPNWGGRPFVRVGWWGPGWWGPGWWGPGWWGPGWGWGAPGWAWGPSYPYGYSFGYAGPGFASPSPGYTSAPVLQAIEAPAQPYYWYFCEPAGAYYPYVKECPSGWVKVSPQPAPSDSAPPGATPSR